ncbi:MAG: outer membrane beta-barrel protein [bacterium]
MNLRFLVLSFLAVLFFSTTAFAEETTGNEVKHHKVGGYFSVGMENAIYSPSNSDSKPWFSLGGGLTYDYYFNEMIGVGAGFGVLEKGDYMKSSGAKMWQQYVVMEIPVGAMFNFSGFRVGAALAFDFTLAGKTKTDISGIKTSAKVSNWDGFRRWNLSPKVVVGYSIPVGPVGILPSLSWSMDILNVKKSSDDSLRFMNLMFNIGVEYGI